MTFQLTTDEIKALRDAQPAIKALEDLIARAERAGLDMTQEKGELARRKELVYGFLREFHRGVRPQGPAAPSP